MSTNHLMQNDPAIAKQPNRAELVRQELCCFSGTEEWHHHPGLFRLPILLTDGAKFVAEKCGPDDTHGAYWLMDVIASYQGEKYLARHEFQTWKLTIHLPGESNASRRGTVTCFDGNKQLVRQEIGHTDFILDDGITLYASVEGDPCSLIILLPSEY